MAKGTGNVLPLDGHPRARSRMSPQESAGVMRDCRELALDRIARSLAGMMDRVEDDLFELAEKSIDREAQNVYLDARAQAREKRPEIEAAFRRHFVDFFNRKVRGESGAEPVAGAGPELTLLAHEDLEGALAVAAMARNLSSTCEGELFALSQRFGFLMQRPELKDDANPLAPATVCAALKDACDQIEAGFKVRMALLQQFEQYVALDLQGVYHDLNAHLVQRHILPEIVPSVRRSSSTSRPAPAKAAVAAKVSGDAPGSKTDVFRVLAQFLGSQQAGGAASAAGNPGAGATGNATAGAAGGTMSLPASAAAGAPQAFLTELTRMHRGSEGAPVTGDVLVNVLRELKNAPQNAGLSSLDAMTIDIVAMLFDFIFEDDEIPGNVKGILGRLQIPFLKVALLDKAFFSSKSHPARRLLDRLAEAAIGLDERSVKGEASVAMIERAVLRVLEEFDTDLALFDALLLEADGFLAEQRARETLVVERTATYIESRERQEIARLIAEDEIARRLEARAWVPPVLRDMLQAVWTRALAHAQLNEGEGTPAWQQLLQTAEDLLWSVEPKALPDERKRLVSMLPALLKNLQAGLLRAEMPDDELDRFLGSLVDCHAAAVKAGLRGLVIVPEGPAPQARVPAAPAIEREMVSAGDMQVEEIRLRTPRGSSPIRNVFTRTGIWTNLSRGTWVEFVRAAGDPLRGRLTWISPGKGVYLFTNPHQRSIAVSISPEALAEQMRLGEARIIDGAPLVDRAVDSMLVNLRGAAA